MLEDARLQAWSTRGVEGEDGAGLGEVFCVPSAYATYVETGWLGAGVYYRMLMLRMLRRDGWERAFLELDGWMTGLGGNKCRHGCRGMEMGLGGLDSRT